LVRVTLALARARLALSSAGLDPQEPIERVSSVTNEVWLSPRYAVRVNRRMDGRLRREALLGPQLPPEIGYPDVVACGSGGGIDWLVVRRRPGIVLSRAWPDLSLDARRSAIAQLARKLRVLHQTVFPKDVPPLDSAPLIDPRATRCVDPLLRALQHAARLPHVDPAVLADAGTFVQTHAAVLEPCREKTVIHGDLTFENVLWDPASSSVSAILDFEWSRAAPADVDLDVLLRFCAYPALHVAEDYEAVTRAEDYSAVPWWLGEEYPALFERPSQLERMKLYALAFDVRELLQFPPKVDVKALPEAHPYHRIRRMLRGFSHLDRLAAEHL